MADKKKDVEVRKVLFNSLEYTNSSEYLDFLAKLEPNKAVVVLVAAAAKAQKLGIYSFEESELIINSIRILTKNSATPEQKK